ncbi:MAG TPA: hypothetical protein VMT15_20415 [Bryobacteraceae bacterium]|nr:hypothetical protein [Bryobacteraceae bacterium]
MPGAQERPYHIQAINDLRADSSPDHFRFAIGECRKVITELVSEDNSSDQQVARVRILRYLDLQLSRAVQWVEAEADLMASVLRSQIELRLWADFVSKSPKEAADFLHEADIDIQELHVKMDKAFPGALQPLSVQGAGKRVDLKRTGDEEEYDFKLCSKLIHPSALMLNHPEATITNQANKEYLAVQVLFYAWLIVSRFHDLVWHD